MSDNEPAAELEMELRVFPGGMRSRSMRAFIRRISRRSSSENGRP